MNCQVEIEPDPQKRIILERPDSSKSSAPVAGAVIV